MLELIIGDAELHEILINVFIIIVVVIVLKSKKLFKNNYYLSDKNFRNNITAFILIFWYWLSKTFLGLQFEVCLVMGLMLMLASTISMIKNMYLNRFKIKIEQEN